MATVRFAGKTLRVSDDRGWSLISNQRTSHLTPYVMRCIDLRAKGVQSVRWLDENDNDITLRPNVAYAIEASLCTHGAAFVVRTKEMSDAFVLNPNTMTVEADENGIKGFTQRIGAKVQRFKPDDIVYIHLWNPNSDVHGLAPLHVAGVDIQIAAAVAQFTAQFFNDGALPPIVIQPAEGQTISETDSQALREAWRTTVQGVRNMWRALFARRRLEIETLEIPHLSQLAMRDVDDIALRRIATAFGVPVTMITDAANYATAKEHRISFWRDTILPEVRLIADAFAKAYDMTIYVDADSVEALTEQEKEKREGIVKLVQVGIITTQEARVYLGIDNQQSPIEQNSVRMWIDELDKWRRKSEARNLKCSDFSSHILPDGVVNAVKSLAEKGMDPFSWARYIPAAIKAGEPPFDKDADKIVKIIARILSEEAKDIVNMSDEEMMRKLALALEPHLQSQAIDSALANMTTLASYADIESIADIASQWASQYTYSLVRGITERTRNAIRNVLQRAIAEGWSNKEIEEKLSPYFGSTRARTIAITETTRAYSKGVEIAKAVLEKDGVETVMVWQTARDERVCPICGPRDGKRYGDGWRDMPPAHPNCRCWVTLELAKNASRYKS